MMEPSEIYKENADSWATLAEGNHLGIVRLARGAGAWKRRGEL
jgi:hypothetical protein